MITVIFQYVVADVSLYPKSLSSAETVKFWPRTGSHYVTPAGIPFVWPAPKSTRLRLKKPVVVYAEPYLGNPLNKFNNSFF